MPPNQQVNYTFIGLLNKNRLLDRLSEDLNEISSVSHLPFGYLSVNINGFADLNREHGPDVGNIVLRETGDKIGNCLQHGEELFHLGADEFAVFQPQIEGIDKVLFLANKILCAVNKLYTYKKEKIEFSIRLGIVFGSGGFIKPDSIIKAGRLACAKVDRTDTIKYYIMPMKLNNWDKKILSMESELRLALERQEFELYYHPIISMKKSDLLGYETLIRWNHPSMGQILPGEFIPVAEKTGLIGVIGEWVLKTACEQAMFWQISGYSSLRLAVNFSSVQITHFKIIELVENIIEETGFDPVLLEIELTESSALTDKDHTLTVMKKLSSMGISFSMDDFGTGFSSLSFLSTFPIKHIKIDSSFVWDLDDEVNSKTIVKAMINMAKFLEMNIIAEGVETDSQKKFLQQQGVQNFQGHIYSKPLPVKKFTELLSGVGR